MKPTTSIEAEQTKQHQTLFTSLLRRAALECLSRGRSPVALLFNERRWILPAQE